jgi:hypothetical protein
MRLSRQTIYKSNRFQSRRKPFRIRSQWLLIIHKQLLERMINEVKSDFLLIFIYLRFILSLFSYSLS